MSLSRIFKKSSNGATGAEPLVLIDLNEVVEEGHTAQEPGAAHEIDLNGKVGKDAEAIEREAYENGFEAGEKAGFEFGRKKAEVLYQGLDSIINELSAFKETILKASEKEMVELSIAIARKVVQSEVTSRKEVVLDCVRAAMRAVVAGGEILIRVNPKDLDVINQFKNDVARSTEGVKQVTIESDESIGRGGCVIETNYGEVDATVGGIIAEIEERLKDGR